MSDSRIFGNLIVASHITGIYDVNRSEVLANDDFSIVSEWANSIAALGLQGVIFHNNFSEATCEKYENEFLHFIKVKHNPKYNPNVFRYFVYNDFLNAHSGKIQNIFFTDVSDVTVLKNPFIQSLYLNNPTSVFCGDEPKILDNEWMRSHASHLRSKITDYAAYEADFKDHTLLNCGVIGGNISVMRLFIEQLMTIHKDHNHDNTTPYTGDMGAFNYLARTKYNDRLIHSSPVNTEFKAYTSDEVAWFKHK